MIQQKIEQEKQQYFEAKKKYARYRVLMWIGFVMVFVFLCLYALMKELKVASMIVLAVLAVWALVYFGVFAKRFLQLRLEYKALKEMVRLNDCVRTGLHKKLWEKYKMTDLAGFLDNRTTIEYIYDHGDSLSVNVLRNDREMGFDVGEDPKELYLWADTGKEMLEEKQIPLSEVEDMVALKTMIQEYFAEYS